MLNKECHWNSWVIFGELLKWRLLVCKISFILIWASTCVITSLTGTETFAITDTKFVSAVASSNQDYLLTII